MQSLLGTPFSEHRETKKNSGDLQSPFYWLTIFFPKAWVRFRLGGDEFLIIVPHTSLADCAGLMKKITNDTLRTPFVKNDRKITVHFSYGIAEYNNHQTCESFIDAADKKLYETKRAKKNI